MIRLSANIIYDVEMDLVKRIQNASYQNFNRITKEEIYTTIKNINLLGDAPGRFITIFVAFLTIVGCLLYLYWLSFIYGLVVTILVGSLIANYIFRIRLFNRKYAEMRALQSEYYKSLNDLIFGFKDIKISQKKNARIFEDFILKNKGISKNIETNLKQRFSSNSTIANYMCYLLLALALFTLPKIREINIANSVSFIVILVYIISPITQLVSFFSFFSGLKDVSKSLNLIESKLLDIENINKTFNRGQKLEDFSEIRFKDVGFEYYDKNNKTSFSLGPINLKLRKGEVVFIVGDNGSGKSTFLNLLTGLEMPSKGNIYYNGVLIDENNYEDYRNKISAVFFEGYLLSEDYEDLNLTSKNKKFSDYLALVKMDRIAQERDIFKSKEKLSKGQQKRLALVLALLTEKKILVLDEWAAEQDPLFREYFYESIIPDLKRQGITIIAITHDHSFFRTSDRIIKFKNGSNYEMVGSESIQY